ncbi:hypothetical protein GOODEAATRI_011267 [Goodea atripinnis]|uniref:Uncharacterized protein n=1 Tax=Goodea atripinnis TaxID=208336 RepID=A0ABV0N0Q5_9TELE
MYVQPFLKFYLKLVQCFHGVQSDSASVMKCKRQDRIIGKSFFAVYSVAGIHSLSQDQCSLALGPTVELTQLVAMGKIGFQEIILGENITCQLLKAKYCWFLWMAECLTKGSLSEKWKIQHL